MEDNLLYYGDNLDVLHRHIKDETVDLVYLDPPFSSNASYNVLTTLENIDAVGNDLDMNQGGGCGKGGRPLPISNGSSHIRIQKCLLGGG